LEEQMTSGSLYTPQQVARIAENIDQLISLDVSNREFITILYPAVRERIGEPLCMAAAKRLKSSVKRGDYVLLTPGMLIYPYDSVAETDGPLGAAVLARVLMLGMGAKPIIVTDQKQVALAKATCRGAGLNITDVEGLANAGRTIAVVGFPVNEEEAQQEARRIFDRLNPKAVIAIERRGRNEKGIYHALPKGRNMNALEAKMVTLFDEAKQRGSLTIGIGDGGNEIGWGIVNDVIRKRLPFGEKCSCGCGAGVGDTTVVDVTVAASISNWGAYGVEACLCVLLDEPELMHDAKVESRMLRECIDAGGIDGVTHMPEPGVDGLPEEIQLVVLSLLREITRVRFRYPDYAYE
jgi:hypothetical protein